MSAPTLPNAGIPTESQYAGGQGPTGTQAAPPSMADVHSALARKLGNSFEKLALCPPAGGGTTQNYSQGTALVFNFPTALNMYIKGFIIQTALTVTLDAGSSAAYAATAASYYALYPQLQILYNGIQVNTHPYITKVLGNLKFRGAPILDQGTLPSVQDVANIDAQMVTVPTWASGANTLSVVNYFPLNPTHRNSGIGMLPSQGSGTKGQIILTCASSFLGPDPLNSVIYATTGTGQLVDSITGTTQVWAVYVDGTNLAAPAGLRYDEVLSLPTMQYTTDLPLSPMSAGQINRQRIASLLNHQYVVAIIIDGRQSNLFSTVANIQQLELDMDNVGQNKFGAYGQNNIPYWLYWQRIRDIYARDLDQGVILWNDAVGVNQQNPDNHHGERGLNMTQGGWTDVNHGYQVGAVTSSTINPRVAMFLVSINPQGLGVVQ